MNSNEQAYWDYLNSAAKSAPKTSDRYVSRMNDLADFAKTLEQRSYDEAWRDNEREYTTPSQQIARYMAAGLSYSQAIQMLSSPSAGTASGVPSQDAADEPSFSQTFSNITQGISNISSSALSVAQTVGSAIQSGYSPRLLRGQQSLQDFEIYDNQQKKDSYINSSQILGYFYNAKRHGVDFDPSKFLTFQEMIDEASKVDWSSYPSANDYLKSSNGLDNLESNIYTRQTLERQWQNRRDSSGPRNLPSLAKAQEDAAYYRALFQPSIDYYTFQNAVFDVAQKQSNISLQDSQRSNLVADTKNKSVQFYNITADTALKNQQTKLVRSQTRLSSQSAITEIYRTCLLQNEFWLQKAGFQDECNVRANQLHNLYMQTVGSSDDDLNKQIGHDILTKMKSDYALQTVLNEMRYRSLCSAKDLPGYNFMSGLSVYLNDTGIYDALDKFHQDSQKFATGLMMLAK